MTRLNYAGRTLLSFVTFNLGWWACALGPKYGYAWAGPALMPIWVGLHLYYSPTKLGEGLFLGALAIVGFAVDSVLIYSGIFHIIPESAFSPAWLVSMWVLLGITFESMLTMRRSLILVCLMGVLSGPLSYTFAQAVEILDYKDPEWLSMVLHGALWAGLMPMLFLLRDQCLRLSLRHQPTSHP